MLSLFDPRPAHDCEGFRRREFLRIGGAGMFGLAAAGLAGREAAAAGQKLKEYATGKSVVFLFLGGGPSHIELFDPKMTAPSEIRSITGEVATVHPGITFGGSFPQLAQLADKFSIVRSFQSKNGGHEYVSVTANNPYKAAVGALYTRIVGSNHPRSGLPMHTLVLPEAVAPPTGFTIGKNFETGHLPGLSQTGSLGPNYQAFDPSGGGPLQKNMELAIPSERFADRRALLAELDRLRRNVDARGLVEGLDALQSQAYDVLLGGAAEAFDLSKEDPATVAKYDTSHCFKNSDVQRWGDMRRSTNLLGRQLLLARRLVEAGCGFVTVSDCGWDMHSNGNSPKNLGGMHWLGPQVDHAVAAFVRDCEERGLTDDVLLVVTGEMGRTPRINNNGGRDHYGELTPLLLYGGGLRMGHVVGQSDSNATRPATDPFGPVNLVGTMMNVLFDVGRLRLDSGIPRDLSTFIQSADPIMPLMG